MAKTFFPKMAIKVKASAPHPPNTEYKVSIGKEIWDSKENTVLKVQMVYDGVIAGRRSPSYPVGTDDFQRVMLASEKLISQLQNTEIEIS